MTTLLTDVVAPVPDPCDPVRPCRPVPDVVDHLTAVGLLCHTGTHDGRGAGPLTSGPGAAVTRESVSTRARVGVSSGEPWRTRGPKPLWGPQSCGPCHFGSPVSDRTRLPSSGHRPGSGGRRTRVRAKQVDVLPRGCPGWRFEYSQLHPSSLSTLVRGGGRLGTTSSSRRYYHYCPCVGTHPVFRGTGVGSRLVTRGGVTDTGPRDSVTTGGPGSRGMESHRGDRNPASSITFSGTLTPRAFRRSVDPRDSLHRVSPESLRRPRLDAPVCGFRSDPTPGT